MVYREAGGFYYSFFLIINEFMNFIDWIFLGWVIRIGGLQELRKFVDIDEMLDIMISYWIISFY